MIATNGTLVKMAHRLGVAPIMATPPKWFELMSRGVVDGTWIPWTIMRPFRLHEVSKFHTEVHLSSGLVIMTMNKARYAKLPAELRKVIDDNTGIGLAKRLGIPVQFDESLCRGRFTSRLAGLSRVRMAQAN